MADKTSIETKVRDENVGVLNSAKKDIDTQAEEERQKQRQEAETEINKVNGKAKQEVDSLYKDYDMAEKLGAVQKLLNERYIRRKMAEWGLSSSGTLNGNLKRAEHLSQKASTLNREVFNKGKLGVTDWKTGQIAEIEKVRDGNIGVIDKNAADLKKQAEDEFNKWVDTETDRRYAYVVEEENKLLKQKNESDANWRNKYGTLISKISNSTVSENQKKLELDTFASTWGFDSIEQANAALKVAGLDSKYRYDQNGALQKISKSPEPDINSSYYTTLGGNKRYHFVIEKATINHFGGVDNDDVVTIYYGTYGNDKKRSDKVVAKNLRIDQLPDVMVFDPVDKENKSLKQAVTDRTAWQKAGDSFYFTTDLSKLNN